MLDFLRPVQDTNLRIMIPAEKSSLSSSRHQYQHQRLHNQNSQAQGSQASSNCDSDDDPPQQHSQQSPTTPRRYYKAYTVMQKSGFQHTEYVQVITHLCKFELLISLIFLIHGLTCPGFPTESSYQGTCHINVLSALVGLFTGGMGLGAVHRFRWKTMLVMSVSNLLAVITTGVWLDHLSKLRARTGLANGLSGMMLLGSVLVGVCFILTSVLICHYWASNSTKYQAVGRVAKRQRSLRRRTSRTGSGNERGGPPLMRHHSGVERLPSIRQYEIV